MNFCWSLTTAQEGTILLGSIMYVFKCKSISFDQLWRCLARIDINYEVTIPTNLDCDGIHYLWTSPSETEFGILSVEINEREHLRAATRGRSDVKQLVLVTLDNHWVRQLSVGSWIWISRLDLQDGVYWVVLCQHLGEALHLCFARAFAPKLGLS